MAHNGSHDIPPWEQYILDMRERLRETTDWCPYVALLSIGLVFVLLGHLLPGLNQRIGNKANILTFSAKPQKDGAIWMGLYPRDSNLIIGTPEGRTFAWPLDAPDNKEVTNFVSYLKDRILRESVATGLSLDTSITRTSAVLSVDQRLNYSQLRPVIAALAEARISRYGFETRLLKN